MPTDTPEPTATPTPVPPTETPTPEPTPTLTAKEQEVLVAEQICPGYKDRKIELEGWWNGLDNPHRIPDEERVHLALTEHAAFLEDDQIAVLLNYCRGLDMLPPEGHEGWIASNKSKSRIIGLHPQYLANKEAFYAMSVADNETFLKDSIVCMFVKEASQVKFKLTTGNSDINAIETEGWGVFKKAAERLADIREKKDDLDVAGRLKDLAHQAQVRIEKQEWFKSWNTF